MRRNTITLLKYALFALGFLIVGPISLKYLFGGNKDNQDVLGEGGQGLPHAPELHGIKRDFVDSKFLETVRPNSTKSLGPKAPIEAFQDILVKVDWHDYAKISEESERTGPGEQGAAVILSAGDEKNKAALYKVNGFNAYASDKISLDRALKDIRHPECHKKKYLNKLPNVSVIVPFHNEHWSTLLRTAKSVLNRSPDHLIHEVILVDDFSSKEHCKKPLDDHVAQNYNGKVKVIHAKKREGLIRTRLLGAKAATGDVLIFLDSHVEANINWLPPLLEPIAEDYRAVVCPFIDVIDFETFAYRAQDEGARGAFDWEFFYKRLPLQPEDLKHPADPFKSPVMAGGLFAISSKWFWELGGYDPGLDIWGGEQYELSFKIWQCHGTLLDAPCSRVGHVYRKFNPNGGLGFGDYMARLWQCGGQMFDAPCSRVGHVYRKFAPFPNPGVGDFVGRNYRRVAEVWMDEYAEYLYKRRPHYRKIDPGDLSEQKAIRKKFNCKPFKWFMEEVAFDLVKYYPPVEPPPIAEGELRNAGANMCVDTRFKGQNERFNLETCIKDTPGGGGEQHFELSWHKDLRPRKRTICFDVSQSIIKAPVILYNCHGMKGNQHWKYNVDTRALYHPISNQCLDCDKERKEIFMNPCNPSSDTQQWLFEHVNTTAAKEEWLAPRRR